MKRSDTLAFFEREQRRRALSPVTIEARLRQARRFLAATGKPVSHVTTDHVRAYLARRRAQGMAATTLALELSHIRAFFLVVRETDPTEGLSVQKGDPRAPLQLSRESVRELLVAALQGPGRHQIQLRDRACLELAYGCGLRVSELAAVRVPDLVLADASLLVRSAKGSEPAVLPVPAASLPHLATYLREGRPLLARGRDQGHMFLTRDGKPMTGRGMTSVVARVGERAGIQVHAHALRRALATHLVAAGVSVEVVRQLLRHADLDVTARYVGVDRAELHRAVRVLDLRRLVGQDV